MSTKSKPTPARRPGLDAGSASQKKFWESPGIWVMGLVLVAGVAAIVLTSGGSDSVPAVESPETAFVEVVGAPLPSFSTPDTGTGLKAPVLATATLDGERVVLGNDGIARVYGFFAHWCPHCQAELPRISSWLSDNDLPDGVEVIAVSTGIDPSASNYPPSEWFERELWPAPVVLDDADSTLATGFGLTGFPYWVAVDSDGIVVARLSGEIGTDEFAALVNAVDPSGS